MNNEYRPEAFETSLPVLVGPAHKSLSNTFRMHQKLNDSFKECLRKAQGLPKASSKKSPNAP
ncbi:MAG: hypothetical protein WDZ64_00465, partial [Parcubacteria group bacterium]